MAPENYDRPFHSDSIRQVELEQYPTSAHLAAWVGLTALENGDIGEGRTCLDLGTGTGMLAIACALLGTDYVLAVDCDEDALQIANDNIQTLELEETIELVLAKLKVPCAAGVENNNARGGNRAGRTKGRWGGRGRGRQGRGDSKQNAQQSTAPVKLSPITASAGAADDGLPLCSKCVDTGKTSSDGFLHAFYDGMIQSFETTL